MDINGPVAKYREQFQRLNVNRSGGHASPHKPCLLLAVIDLIEDGTCFPDHIPFTPALQERFRTWFDLVRRTGDQPKSHYPFFHLRSEPFWTLVPLAGRDQLLAALSTVPRVGDVTENINHAVLDEGLTRVLLNPAGRQLMREAVIDFWFPGHADALWALVDEQREVNAYARQILQETAGPEPEPEQRVRDSAFRRLVLSAYDYRCAATGWRVVTPDGSSLVDAAHLVPWAESHDDRPSNGMALTPTFHRALDRNLIAPGPDLRWHVSNWFDQRIADHQPFLKLQGQRVLVPPGKWAPDVQGLEWRVAALVGA